MAFKRFDWIVFTILMILSIPNFLIGYFHLEDGFMDLGWGHISGALVLVLTITFIIKFIKEFIVRIIKKKEVNNE